MASSAAPRTVPNLRNMRDTYVNLLLSNGQQPAEAAPQTPRPSWTPGQSLGTSYKEHAVHWASPVTPVLTENEMRVAEVAANLVAAGDAEKRNKDAIRTLADKLEQTEKRNRELEAAVRAEGKKKKERRRVSYGDARRNIHFTPRTPRRSGGLDLGGERRRSGRQEREWMHESPFPLELENLRMERARWHQEREKFRSMMTDIKRNTSRLLEEREKLRRHRDASAQERDSHLQVIARLQDQLMEMKEREELEAEHPFGPIPGSAIDPIPHRTDDECRFSHLRPMRDRDFLAVPPVGRPHSPNDGKNECHDQTGNLTDNSERDDSATSLEGGISEAQDGFGREEELQTELHLVNQENIRVSERNATLKAENAQLKERMCFLETEHANILWRLEDRERRAGVDAAAGNSTVAVADTEATIPELSKLLDEINILESVSVAIHFEISPSEADRAQETLSDVGSFTSEREVAMTATNHDLVRGHGSAKSGRTKPNESLAKSPFDTLKYAAQRLAVIRTDLCAKYGKWLEAVANDVSSAGGETDIESIGKENILLFDVASECMNTKVINELMES